MNILKTLKLAMAFGVCAPFIVGITPQVAQSQTLFELIFKQRIRKPIVMPRVAIKKVSAPRFFNYKVQALTRVKFGALVKLAEDLNSVDKTQTGVVEADPEGSSPLVREQAKLENQEFLNAVATLTDYNISARKDIGKAVVDHYLAKPDFFWIEDGQLPFKTELALGILSNADDVGLISEDYQVEIPEHGAGIRELIQFEMNMSLKVVRFALDARNGRINPNKLSGYHDFPKPEFNAEQAMSELTAQVSPSSYLASASPTSAKFMRLRETLAALRHETADLITIAEGTFIRPGQSHEELPNVIAAIRKKGTSELLQRHGETLTAYSGSTDFTDDLVALVRGFQQQVKLNPDGIVGRNTISRLVDLNPQQKMNRVRLAMERLRWHPRNLGPRHVFINQPAYRARYIQDGEETLSMRAIVGKPSNQTNFFHDTIERVEYNPYWGVPQSIIVNEMLPELRADPSYLDARGYEVTTLSGQQISSASINWYALGGGEVPYNVRQYPGASNALGELKILFPNKHAIYMHDTPSRGLFKKTTRALSHGCVRLQNPRGMAAAVLGTTVSRIGEQISKGRNHAQELNARIPVYVAYFTAWPNKDGEVEYFADMYGRDKHLIKAISKVAAMRKASA